MSLIQPCYLCKERVGQLVDATIGYFCPRCNLEHDICQTCWDYKKFGLHTPQPENKSVFDIDNREELV